jgi:hypothetical protein
MALNPRMHVTLTIEELEDIKNSAMQRAEEMEWQLRVELQKVREIERSLSRILGEASQVAPAAASSVAPAAPGVARGTPMHGTSSLPAAPIVAAAAAPAPVVAPVAAPAPGAMAPAKTVPTVRPSWSPPPPPPVSTTSSTSTSVVRRLPPPPPPLPANVHRLPAARKA